MTTAQAARASLPGSVRIVRSDDAAFDRVNHFHLIRLLAALLVLFAHAFHLLDRGGEEPIGRWLKSIDASRLGVMMFFVISGFLVAHSAATRAKLRDFIVARALRIVPALWLALIVTVFAIGPAFTTLSLAQYFSDSVTWKYLALNAILRPQYLLPGVFESNPLPGVNGSLWTIPLEVVCYAILAVLAWTHVLSANGRSIAQRFGDAPWSFVAMAVAGGLLAIKIAITGAQYYELALYFAIGVLGYRFRHRIRLNLPVAAALIVVVIAVAPSGLARWVMPIALPYALLAFALHPALSTTPTWLHRHDYSYGTYLYGFPVQQAAIAMGIADPMMLLAVAAPVTIALAALSWHVVERRALAMKTTTPVS